MKKLFIFLLISINIIALEPPRKGEIEKLKKMGLYEKRLDFAKKLGNYNLKVESIREKRSYGLPSIGNQKIFVLLVEFLDYPHQISQIKIKDSLFGDGEQGYFPYESLKEFYIRSSYGLLEIDGEVFGWYKAKKKRSYYNNDAEGLIKEVLNHYDPYYDFSQFDNDGDGVIDYFAVYWTGPDEGWASFWWGWNGTFGDPNYKIDGKKLYNFTWQWEEESAGTIIHETGHALGLPDYYDYDDSIGPRGGMGGMDTMDGVWGDHNGFSKWVLGWVQPIFVDNLSNISLRPQASYPDLVVLGKEFDGTTPYGEYFLIQNRTKILNDKPLPGEGFLILHIDSRKVCGGDFLYNNSYTEHKLVRVMEADGKEDIESGKWGDEGDFYKRGMVFSPKTFPSSHFYDGSSSGVWVRDIESSGMVLSANFILNILPHLPKVNLYQRDRQTIPLDNPVISWQNLNLNEGYFIELHKGANTILKEELGKDKNSYQIPSKYFIEGETYNFWVKAKADEENFSSSPYTKVSFVINCQEGFVIFQKTYDPPPCSSWMPAISYDYSTNKIIVFGGKESTTTEEFDGNLWSYFETNPAPPKRWYTTSSFDPINEGILLFGGWDFDLNMPLGDTWFYNSKTHTWEEKFSEETPFPNWACKMATNIIDKYILLYCPSSTYKWDGEKWTLVYNASTPRLYYTDIAYHPKLNGFILFGGVNSDWDYSNNTYFFDGNKWSILNLEEKPLERSFHRLITNPKDKNVYLYGGEWDWYYMIDLWKFDGEKWEEIEFCSDFPFDLWPPIGDFFYKDNYFFMTNGDGRIFEFTLPDSHNHKRPFK